MPGHVAQMQRLFQNAKASLRLDVRFASSPVGSIDSRLPGSPEDEINHETNVDLAMEAGKDPTATPSKNWRYSRAPGFLAGLDTDVREPFPEGSPQLPAMHPLALDYGKVFVAEPPSSGFTSPVDQAGFNLQLNDGPIQSSPPVSGNIEDFSQELHESCPSDDVSAIDLERPMTELRVSDGEIDVDLTDDSPIVSHLKRKSVDAVNKHMDSSSGSGDKIVLSPSAGAAAHSAKLKRGLFTDLFPKPPTHKGSSQGTPSSSNESEPARKPCPDPLMHHGGPAVRCPDPTAHFAAQVSTDLDSHGGHSPRSNIFPSQHVRPEMQGHPPVPFNRATATGSPMPLLKVRPPPGLGVLRQGPWYPPTEYSSRTRPGPRYHQHLNPSYISTASEHFQPGWYYAKDSPRSSPRRPGPVMYSFSTAAAKGLGHDPAPDSMIRDSYRTDTLTPLAKPPSRFRKNGISAMASASARGTGKHYGGPSYLSRPPRRMNSMRSRMPDSLQFRSSPPRSSLDSAQLAKHRKRSRDLVSPTSDILEDETAGKVTIDPRLRLEDGEEVIEVDEETRAAVRMSMFGTATPDNGSEAGSGLNELSPNVMLFRKGTGPSGSRKQRRPSYWDGDLEEVVRSPAARHFVFSPIKKDDVRSLQAEVEFHDNDADKENQMQAIEDALQDASRFVEGPTVLQDDVAMEDHEAMAVSQYD
ncbi:hypothetical protein H2200_007999 [Cladophialophora chaetospira]|uniref:Uncharacterized protein n=1 Tax=Cladophialophora chaetospira TaxID=386627 RepID=A0AA38X6T3_9EURO|nr:hypothetical protein H2200_007999 [Cladophialophora chaetospira]